MAKRGKRKAAAAPATPAQNVEQVGTLNRRAADLAQDLYNRRFAKEGTTDPEPLQWPLLHGGTFLEVAQRAWSDDGGVKLIDKSFKFLQKIGYLDDSMTRDRFVAGMTTTAVPRTKWNYIDCI